jgi:hypothetical protein
MRILTISLATLALALPTGAALAQGAPKIGDPPEARDMTLLGSHDLQARGAYQPIVHEQNGRWIAFIGHHGGTPKEPKPLNPLTGQREFNGTSILDVTDPRAPRYLTHIPGEEGEGENGGGQMVRWCRGRDLPKGDPAKFYLLRTFGNSAHEVWDVTVPEKPSLLSRIGPVKGTHKNWWECDTGIAYLVSGAEGWRTRRMTQIYDLSDPAKPVLIRDFGLPGQQAKPGEVVAGGAGHDHGAAPPARGGADVPTELHGPISTGPAGNRVYFGYGTNKNGILQIVDRQKLLAGPKEPTDANLVAPQISRLDLPPNVGAHTTLPLLKMKVAEFAADKEGGTRDFIAIVNESLVNECQEARQILWIVDVTTETKPFGVATWTVTESTGGFCSRGGRFGTHSSNENMPPMYANRILFLAHFNAGVRAIDIRNPFAPKEIAHFIPPITDKTTERCIKVNNVDRCKTAIQTNNLEVDDRGYVYAVDRANTGLHILELAGQARGVAQGLRPTQ